MVAGIIIIAILLAVFVVLLRQAGSARPPLLQRLREKGGCPGRTELLLCRRQSFVSAGQLMTEREQRFLRRLDRGTDKCQWRLCPQVRVADIVRVAPDHKSGSSEWWQLFRLVSQWHNLLLEEVLKQWGITLLRGDNAQQLVERIRVRLCAQRPETAA